MHIALFKRIGTPYDYVDTKSRPWLQHLKRKNVSPEESVYNYIKFTYLDIKITLINRNRLDKASNNYDIVFLGFEELTLPFKELVLQKQTVKKYDNYIKNIKPCRDF